MLLSTDPTLHKLVANYTFTNFARGEENEFAYNMISREIDAIARQTQSRPLLLSGAASQGKTHLTRATINTLLGAHICQAYATASNMELPSVPSSAIDLLIIDDLPAARRLSASKQQALARFINDVTQQRTPVIMTAYTPSIAKCEPTLQAILDDAITIQLEAPRLELRRKILRQISTRYDLSLDKDILRYLAEKPCNPGQYTGIIKTLIAQQDLLDIPITLNQAKNIYHQNFGTDLAPTTHTIRQRIIQTVAEHYQLEPEAITGSQQGRTVIRAKQMAMYLLHTMANITYSELGREFKQTHPLPYRVITNIQKRREIDDNFRIGIIEMQNRILKNT